VPCRQGYGLARGSQTVGHQAVGEHGLSTDRSLGREARPASATLVTMEPWDEIDLCWRSHEDGGAFAEWVADRCAVTHDHLVQIAEVGRDETGAVVARAAVSAGLPLPDALDRIGAPTVGVAVTLTLPLLEVARLADGGAVLLGTARVEDVLVDDAGAVLVVDRPPGVLGPVPAGSVPGAEALVLAVRAVWDRVDPREPACAGIDALCTAARSAGGAALAELEQAVRAAAPPRPVRWDPPPLGYGPAAAAMSASMSMPTDRRPPRGSQTGSGADVGVRLAAWLSQAVTSGIPLGARRVGIRSLFTALVVVLGLVVAGVTASEHPTARTAPPAMTRTAPPPVTRTAPPPTRGNGAVQVVRRVGIRDGTRSASADQVLSVQYPRFGAKLPSSRRFFTATRYRDASAPSMMRWSYESAR
jgi:hypothetical protein